MILVNCQSIGATHGGRPLFSGLCLTLNEGDRVGMIGPNGSGKSTLLRIVSGAMPPDSGQVTTKRDAVIAYVPQVPEFDEDLDAEGVLMKALPAAMRDTPDALAATRIALGEVGFDAYDQKVGTMSGGWKKRLALARALVVKPDLMLLDEPTNHLDVEGVLWLEKLLLGSGVPFLVVSHDRVFLENVAQRMVELNRVYPTGSFEAPGNYSEFLVRRDEYQRSQARTAEVLENKVRREIEWLRRGAKARTTKAQSRIDSAGRLIEKLDDVRDRLSGTTARVDFVGSGRRTRNLMVAEGISRSIAGRLLFEKVDVGLGPGERLGVVGRNGSGKTTLLRTLVGEVPPDEGKVTLANDLQLVYFDQHRGALDLGQTLRHALTGGTGEHVRYREQNLHVVAWAKRFAFRTEQLDVQLDQLSGGEQARVAIARLMQQPADLLVLDEPTNDLDMATLEVLEDNLLDFPGAVILVTHDRYMLGRLSTMLLALDGEGGAHRMADLAQWEAEQARWMEGAAARAKAEARASSPAAAASPKKVAKGLTFKEKKELDAMEASIMQAEEAVTTLEARIQEPSVASDRDELQKVWQGLEVAKKKVESLYARWAELEAKQATT